MTEEVAQSPEFDSEHIAKRFPDTAARLVANVEADQRNAWNVLVAAHGQEAAQHLVLAQDGGRTALDRLGVPILDPAPIPQRWHVTLKLSYDAAEFGPTVRSVVHAGDGPPDAVLREAIEAAAAMRTRAGLPEPWIEMQGIHLVPLAEDEPDDGGCE